MNLLLKDFADFYRAYLDDIVAILRMRDELENGKEEYADVMEAALTRLENRLVWHKRVLYRALDKVRLSVDEGDKADMLPNSLVNEDDVLFVPR
ncbi:uncharacterized protein PGRI_085080 [Penicillium griseofulvum]|uniref:Uncharacterized protein n=1 Tax=Penicillium patulum TaxID=5078 RepID=A0A135LTB6_PENPA|nr:uncharacterized protein PGRI_085080 [Penicillium griseofulvum]KXG52224.1 hypothetical protein PGRI_085080 [Penicillium griseofulvum]